MRKHVAAGKPSLYVFIDESGNFDFAETGTRNFVMAAISTTRPSLNATALLDYRYQLLSSGANVAYFHATEDRQYIRDQVLIHLNGLTDTKCHVTSVDKRELPLPLCSSTSLHAYLSKELLQGVLNSYEPESLDGVIVVVDQALPKKQQGAFHEALKPLLKSWGLPFQLHFQQIKFDANGQFADYVAWSKYIQVERCEGRPWQTIEEGIGAETVVPDSEAAR